MACSIFGGDRRPIQRRGGLHDFYVEGSLFESLFGTAFFTKQFKYTYFEVTCLREETTFR